MLCRFVLLQYWHVRCLSTVAVVVVLCRHVAAVIRAGPLRFEGRRARCCRPSALSSLSPTFGRLPALGHSSQLREISAFAVENFAVHVDWPVVVQSVAVRFSAKAKRQPFGARVFVRQISKGIAYGGTVLFAERVHVPTRCRCTEVRAELEREWIGQQCLLASYTEFVGPNGDEAR